jgi:hypothetical protein
MRRNTKTPPSSTNIDPMEAAIEEIKSLPYSQSFAFLEIARKHVVVRSTLIRQYKAITKPCTVKPSPWIMDILDHTSQLTFYLDPS